MDRSKREPVGQLIGSPFRFVPSLPGRPLATSKRRVLRVLCAENLCALCVKLLNLRFMVIKPPIPERIYRMIPNEGNSTQH